MSADHGDSPVPGRHTSDGETAAAPRFDVVVRGYDRRQVDEHIPAWNGRYRGNARIWIRRARVRAIRGGYQRHQRPENDERSRAGAAALFGTGGRPGGGSGADSSGGLTRDDLCLHHPPAVHPAGRGEEAEEVRTNARNYARKEEDAGRARLAELERRRETTLAISPGCAPSWRACSTPPSRNPRSVRTCARHPTAHAAARAAAARRQGPWRAGADGSEQAHRADRPSAGFAAGGRRQPAAPPSPGTSGRPDGGQGRPLPSRQAPGQGARPPGPAPQGSPVHQSGAQNAPSPKPRPTPSPRPRANPPAPDGAGVSGVHRRAPGRRRSGSGGAARAQRCDQPGKRCPSRSQ